MYRSPRRSARRRMPTTSDPAPGSDMVARDQLGQVFALLRVAAVAADLIDAEVGMRAIGEPDRCRGARNFLHRDDVRQVANRATAVFLLDGDAKQAERTELAPQVGREF